MREAEHGALEGQECKRFPEAWLGTGAQQEADRALACRDDLRQLVSPDKFT